MANTTAPLSEVAVASMAASMLDEFRIVDLDSDDPMCRFFAREFGQVRDEIIQLYPWHAFSTRAKLSPLEAAPEFGWSYAYNLPADCIRLLPLRVDGKLNGLAIAHELEGRQILCNSPTLNIRYLFRQTNMAKWPPLTARAFAARLARYAATRVTGKTSFYQKCDTEYKNALLEATNADSLERGTTETYNTDGYDVFNVRGLTSY